MIVSNQKDIPKEFTNSQFIMRVGILLDDVRLLAVSTSPGSSIVFGDYLAQHRYLKFLSVGGYYGSDSIGGVLPIR